MSDSLFSLIVGNMRTAALGSKKITGKSTCAFAYSFFLSGSYASLHSSRHEICRNANYLDRCAA